MILEDENILDIELTSEDEEIDVEFIAKGDPGRGIKTIETFYLASSSNENITIDSLGWTKEIQVITPEKRFLWSYDIITYTDDTTSTTQPCVKGVYGKEGTIGPQGKQGKEGPIGPPGPVGRPGKDGVTYIPEIKKINTIDSQSNASASIDVVENKMLFTFNIPRGEDAKIIKKVSGSLININDALEYDAEELTIFGETEQSGISSSNEPQEIENIKGITNVFDISQVTNQEKNGVNCTIDNTTGIITLNGTCTKNNTCFELNNTMRLSGDYILSYEYLSGNISNQTVNTIINFIDNSEYSGLIVKLLNKNNYIKANISNKMINYNKIRIDSGVILNDYKIRIMLKESKYDNNYYVPYGTWLPIKSVGKNLINYTNKTTNWAGANINTNKNIISYTPKSDGSGAMDHSSDYVKKFIPKGTTITYSQKYISGNAWTSGALTNIIRFKKKDGNVINIGFGDITPTNYNILKKKTYTLTDDVYEMVCISSMYGVIGMPTSLKYSVQLEIGDTVSNHEEYKESIALIDMNKENIFDGELVLGSLGNAGDLQSVDYRLASKNYIKVKSLTQYIITNSMYTNGIVICFYDENYNLIRRDGYAIPLLYNHFTTTNNTKYIKFCNGGILNNPSIDMNAGYKVFEGSTPYYELSGLEDIKDIFKNGVLTKNFEKLVLTGYESITRSTTSVNENYRFAISIPNCKMGLDINVISTHYENTKLTTYSNYGIGGRTDIPGVFINDQQRATMTVEEFSAFLREQYTNGTPVTIYYELAEPQVYEVSHERLKLMSGINHINIESSLQASNMNLTYFYNCYLDVLHENEKDFSTIKGDIKDIKEHLNNNVYNKDESKKNIINSLSALNYVGKNLILASNCEKDVIYSSIIEYELSESLVENSTYTLSIKGQLNNNKIKFALCNSNDDALKNYSLNYDANNDIYFKTFSYSSTENDVTDNTHVAICLVPNAYYEQEELEQSSGHVDWIKLEKNNNFTGYSEATVNLKTFNDFSNSTSEKNSSITFTLEKLGNWVYKKYENGLIEMFNKETRSISLSNQYGAAYWANIGKTLYPIELKEIYSINTSIACEGHLVGTLYAKNPDLNGFELFVYDLNQNLNNTNMTIFTTVVGRWK